MIDGFLQGLVVATALGCGLVGGIFFAFSLFVMPALKRLPADDGMSAMQSINITAVMPPFMAVFFGTAIACVVVTIWAIVDWQTPASFYLVVGAGLYLIGVLVLTAVYHVPRNDALAAVDPAAGEAAEAWKRYLREWTRWNHVRAVTSLAAAAAFTIGLLVE